ncbi:MAG TPA: GDSL-type esterase/lipase family protein [Angustibacter sp.]|nr:GDSL-type esterase/lipase family protein [Angustibacter sp.]
MPYSAFLLGLVALSFVAGSRRRAGVVLLFVVLVVLSSWIGATVRRDRAAEAAGEVEDGALARLVLTVAQLVVGLALFAWGAAGAGFFTNAFFFVGFSLTLMSAASFVSEARHARAVARCWPWLVLVCAVMFLESRAIPFGSSLLAVAAIAGVLGEVATELTSERSHDWAIARAWPVWLVLGAGVLAGVAVWMHAAGMTWGHAALAIAGVIGLVWMASSDSAALAVVLVAAGILVWAGAPREVAPDASVQPKRGEPYFLVLGDSYTSGEGAPNYLDGTNRVARNGDRTNECRRAPTAWGLRLARRHPDGVPSRVVFVACSGALTEDIVTTARLGLDGRPGGPAELGEFARVRDRLGLSAPAFVVVGIGGNDAGFSTVGATCVGPGDCSRIGQRFLDDPDRPDVPAAADPGALPPTATRPPDEDLAAISDDLDAAYDRIRAAVGPGVPVLAVPYPVPLGDAARCTDGLLQPHERAFLRKFVPQLNGVVAAAAARHGFLYVDSMERALTDEGDALCEGPGAAAGLNLVALNPKGGTARDALDPANWFHNSLHPTPAGHAAMEAAVEHWLAAHPGLTTPTPDPAARFPVASIEQLLGANTPRCAPDRADRCQLQGAGWQHAQLTNAYRGLLGPVALSFVGAWLLLAPLLWFGREHDLNLAAILRLPLT